MSEENEISKLKGELDELKLSLSRTKNELSISRRNLNVVVVIFIILVTLLSIGWFTSYFDATWQPAWQTERNNFEFYYAALCKQRYGVDDLDTYLNRWQWTEGSYIANRFDCSEMSAYIEWRLENEGYHTIIVSGVCPWDSNTRHSWLLVETSEDKYMPVEATTFRQVKWENPYFDDYFDYDHSFETIMEALDWSYNDYNWWES